MEHPASDERRVNTLNLEAHVCFLYETEDQLRAVLTSFFQEGLGKNEKIICIEDATFSGTPLDVLCSESADLGASLKTGQLTILKAEGTYLRSGVFDPDEMIALLKGYTEEALAEGYAGLRVTGQMTWALRDLPGADRLLEYEARLNDFFPGSRCLALCRYPVKHFPAPLLLDVLRTHPQVVIGTEVYDNPHYVPPSILLGTDRSALDLRRWIADMVQRKAGDAALRASEAYFREITENASDMVLIVNREGILTYVSPSIERFMGYRPEELIGRPAFDLIHPSDRQRAVIDFAAAVQAQETAIPNSFRVLHKDGSERVFEGLGKNLLNHPAIAGFIMNVQDVTDRVSAEQSAREADEALHMAAKNWQMTFDAMLDPVVILKTDGDIIQCNQAFVDFVGLDAAAVVGQKCFQIVHRTKGHIDGCPLLRSIQSEDREIMPMSVDTEEFLVVTDPVKGSDGKVASLVHIMRNITELKRTEEAVLKEKEFTDAIIQSLPGVFYLIDENMRLVRWNTNSRRVPVHYTGEEISTMHPLDFFLDDEKEKIIQGIHEAFQNGQSSVEASLTNKDGATSPYLFLSRVFALGDRKYLAGMGIDISQRKGMERALRESEERFRDLYDEAPVGYFEYDLEGNITRVNRSELELLGYTAEEMIGQPCWEFIVDPEARVQILEKLAGNRPVAHSQERTYRRKDGTTFPVLFEDRLLTGKEGQITGIRTTIQDITEHKRAEEALREIEERFSGFAKASGYGFAIGKLSGELVFGNSAMLKIVEEDQESDFIAKTFYEYYTQEDRRILETEILPFVMEKGQWKGELPLFTAKGNVAQTEQNIFLIRDQLGAPYMLGNITTGITERKASEAEREELQAQLMQAQKMESVGRLAGGVAHDFNNKLSVILGYTQLAMDGLDRGNPLYETLQQVLKAGNQSVDIVRQLLAFARKQTISPEVLDLNEVVEGMLKMLRRLIGEDLDLVWEPGRHLWCVKMDPAQIDQVLANLCVNARDAISGVGKVSIETQNTVLKEGYCAEHAGAVPGDYVMLAVSDTGCGMKRETLQSIFEPFFTTKELGKGTGLGLSTVYGIVKQNQGYIDVVSEPGRGACFRIYLPRHHGPAEREMETFEPSLMRGGGQTILAVEDDASLLHLTQVVLAQAGYHVLAAASPIEAMEMVRQHDGEIDLLLTDIVMPQMSGVELANEIDKMRPNTKTLFMSGYAMTAELNHETRERAVPLLEKPFTPNSLTRKVGEVLGN